MPDHPLDNPVWEALRTHHACLARHSDAAARYDAPFAAVSDVGPQGAAALAALLDPGEKPYGVGPLPGESPLLEVEDHGPLTQMVWTIPFDAPRDAPVTRLTDPHLADMVALTALVYPDYFRPRAPQMGRYLGIYDVARSNLRAKTLYDRLGFVERSAIPYWQVRRTAGATDRR